MKQVWWFWNRFVRPGWKKWEWPVVGALALVAFSLGAWGFARKSIETDQPLYWLDILFQSVQLFVLQLSLQSPMPWQLNVARWLAPLVAGYTAIQALSELLAEEFLGLRLRLWGRGHVIICGLGRKGMILARGFLQCGRRVVVIEQDAENDRVRQCRELGIPVLLGDAAQVRLLVRAGANRAECLFAFCGDDGVNADIAVQARSVLAGRDGPPLTCVLHIVNPQLHALLQDRALAGGAAGSLQLEFVNTCDLGARVLLEEFPLATAGPAGPPRIVIVGLGGLGESLLVHAARQWKASAAGEAALDVVLVDRIAREVSERLLAQHPGLDRVCSLTVLDMDVNSAAFHRAEFLDGLAPDALPPCVFVCVDDDSLGLSTALALVRERQPAPTVVVRMAQETGLAALLGEDALNSGRFHNLHAFGLLDRTCRPDQMLRGVREVLARAIHEQYLRQQREAGATPEQNSSLVPWEDLGEHLKESNRQQADDIAAKLRAVGCAAVPNCNWDEPLFAFTPDEVERLARMEHERWMAAKEKAGWRPGPTKSETLKTHTCLVPYDDLSEDEREKDRSAVRQIPALLQRIGFGVHRLR